MFGEHAVVYGQPAIAIPVNAVQAQAEITDTPARQHFQDNPGSSLQILAPDIDARFGLNDGEQPLVHAARLLLAEVGLTDLSVTITMRSTIPIASGMGSGAATTAALVKALALHLDREDLAQPETVNRLNYEVEKLHHGTPSGIDNTVVSYARPVFFIKREPDNLIETFTAGAALHLLIGDTGIASPTKLAVADVRQRWRAEPERFNRIFAECGACALAGREAITSGNVLALGPLMAQNQRALQEMTVSSPELERLVEAALAAGAMGAKLSGGGRGGNMIALVDQTTSEQVAHSLKEAGAKRVITTTLSP